MHFWRFHAQGGYFGPEYIGTMNHAECVIAAIIAIIAALAMLPSIDRMRSASSQWVRLAWLAAGSVVMAFGIWGMHFTAMLAYSLPVPMTYDLATTVLSVIPAIAGCAIALVISEKPASVRRVPLGALPLAIGVGTMHYVGMEAIRADVIMHYDPLQFAASIVVAYILGAIGLYAVFKLRLRGTARFLPMVPGAVVLGLSVTGMHFMAMEATHFVPADAKVSAGLVIPDELLAYGITTVCLLIVGTLLIASVVDQRLASISSTLRESEARHRNVVANMLDGHIIIDSRGLIQSVNRSAETMFGYRAAELLGRNVKILMQKPIADDHDRYLAQEQIKPSGILGMKRDVDNGGRRKDGSLFPVELCVTAFETGEGLFYSGFVRDLSEKRLAEEKSEMLVGAVESIAESVLILERTGRIIYANRACIEHYGKTLDQLLGRTLSETRSGRHSKAFDEMDEAIRTRTFWSGMVQIEGPDGKAHEEEMTLSPLKGPTGKIREFVAVGRDVTEQQSLQRQLGHAQKLEAIGQLAAGIAHEINTPSQYVGDNTRFLMDAYQDIGGLLDKLQDLVTSGEGSIDNAVIASALAEADVDYLREEIPRAIEQSLEGITRVTRIVRAMKEFSHPSQEKTAIDLNKAIESTITVATNEWKYVANVETDLDDGLPLVECLPGEINQVVLNMLVNAAHAIGDAIGGDSGDKGTISVSTHRRDRWAEIRIRDTGAGIPADVQDRIFDPFFTTKPVGRGTGQGLSIAYSVIVDKHGGSIDVESEPGKGTCFTIRLPIDSEPGTGEKQAA